MYHGLGGTAEEVAEQSHAIYEKWGFTAFKTSPYQLNPESDRWGRVCSAAAKFFEDLRSKTPAQWEFAFDPHGRIFEPVRALQLANALAAFDPYFYEEPLRPEHFPAWARLRSQMLVPLLLRDVPGLGIDVDEDALRDNEIIHWQRTCQIRPDGSTAYI